MSSPTAHPPLVHTVGSASIWVLGQVAGPRRSTTVVHTGPDAVYLDLAGSCLAVLSSRAVQVPCGVRTVLPTLPEVPLGAAVVVHDGAIEFPRCEVLLKSIVDTTVPVLSSTAASWAAGHLPRLVGDRVDAVRGRLPPEALAGLSRVPADPACVDALLGLGEGLTPLGDDVLAGWLATAVAARHPSLTEVRSAVARTAHDRTTLLSATLLSCAARGEGLPEFRSLLSGVAAQREDLIAPCLDQLYAIGDTSGAGLVLGALIALGSATGPGATG
jgi:hypothetical protein